MDRKTFVVVSDRVGFVGAFADVAGAREALRKYAGFPFVYSSWPCAETPAAGDPVWVVPYTANQAVAYAATDKAVAEKAQAALLRLELVPPEDLHYWEAEVGAVGLPALRRLDDVLEVADAVSDATPNLDQEAVDRFLEFASRHEPDPAEEQRINLLESVVPCDLAEDPVTP